MSGPGSDRRVLIVDDERVVADTLAMILSKSGYATKVAYSGEQALELASVFEPNLLITEVVMSGITGFEVANQIAGSLPSCKVIMFSGQAQALILLIQRTAERFEILAKPVAPPLLLDRITRLT